MMNITFFIYFLVTTDEDVLKFHLVETSKHVLLSTVVVLSPPLARYLSLRKTTRSLQVIPWMFVLMCCWPLQAPPRALSIYLSIYLSNLTSRSRMICSSTNSSTNATHFLSSLFVCQIYLETFQTMFFMVL